MNAPQPESARVALLREWKTRAEIALFAHNLAANRCKRAHLVVGSLSATLSAVVGTSVFAAIADGDPPTGMKIAAGVASILAATFAALATFASLPEKMDEYLRAARRYGELRREIEDLLTDELRVGQDNATVEAMRARLDQAAQSSPNPPQRVFDKVRRQRRGHYTFRERLWNAVRGLPPEVRPVPPESNAQV